MSDVQIDRTKPGTVFWVELRYSEGGRGVVCSSASEGQVTEWTPEGFSVQSKVHEYGGGAFCVDSGVVYFSNSKDQALYKQKGPDVVPERLTTEERKLRIADGKVYEGGIYCVMEDHNVIEKGESKEPKNSLVRVDTTDGSISTIAEGADFYAYPELNQHNEILWMQWNHPNMPWDGTEIWRATLDESGRKSASASKLLGEGSVNYQQARWDTEGRRVFCISDIGNWWNIYEVETSADGSGKLKRNVFECESDLGGPHWVFGLTQHFVIGTDTANKKDFIVFKHEETLRKKPLDDERNVAERLETGFTSHGYLKLDGRYVYSLCSAPTKNQAVLRYDLGTKKCEVMRWSRDEVVDHGYISVPKEIHYPTGDSGKQIAHAFLYLPQNKDYTAPAGTLPPLIVMAHGGPTTSASTALELKKQYYTSKGFAILDVNYRGSTGYGRKYRDALKTQWGIVDIEDCCKGARHLVNEKIVDGNKLCITGGSAGGYVVLRAVAWPGLFKAACSHYGVSDIEALEQETHKFESNYNTSLIAPYPEGVEVYRERSPINHLDKIYCPVGFFQGLDDMVVPPNQTRAMFEAVKKKGYPTMNVEFEGEGHGFRTSENIRLALDGEYYYFCKVVGIRPSLIINSEKMNILNLEENGAA